MEKESEVVNSETQTTGAHQVIYCVHGQPSGCCATVVSETNSNNQTPGSAATHPTPISLFDDHCHQLRERTGIDKRARRKLILASILCVIFMLAEVAGGVLSSSLAIATDAAHLLTDFASFMISLFALWVGNRPATKTMMFGWYRAEVLGALTSVLMIWVVTGILFYIAVERIITMNFDIEADIMLLTSVVGVVVNIAMVLVLHQHHHAPSKSSNNEENGHKREDNINVRAAMIHVIGDFIQSFGVLLASLIIFYKPDWKIVDPICTFLFSILVLMTTFAILRDTMIVLMEGMPKGVDFADVLNTFMSIDGVVKVHNLRIWALSLDKTALAAHLAIKPGVSSTTILKIASRKIHNKFNVFEMTLQIEEFQEQMENCKQCQQPIA